MRAARAAREARFHAARAVRARPARTIAAMTPSPRRLLLILLAPLLLTGAEAHGAVAPLTAAFTVDPAAPVAGETVTFRQTSYGGGTGALTVAWDLDGDGAYDDGDQYRAERAYAAGTHVVAGAEHRQEGLA